MPLKTRKITKEIGEGRSKSIYIPPECHDTAVLIAFFNPAKFRRILANALYIIKILKEQNIPLFTVECVFHRAKPQIPHADLVLHSNSYMFYKEQLWNKLEPIVPEKYTKLVFLDADVMFDTPDWVDQISKELDVHDIIQPYDQASWLTPDNKRIRSKKFSYAAAIVMNKPLTNYNIHEYHPGFAWALKRDIFRRIGGFFSRSIIGGGDVTFAINLLKTTVTNKLFSIAVNESFGNLIFDEWKKYNKQFKLVNPSLGFLRNRALHLFHGVKENRQYVSRYYAISNVLTKSWDEEILLNKDGLFEFKNDVVNKTLLGYFKGRNEDIPIEEANRITRKRKLLPTEPTSVRRTLPVEKGGTVRSNSDDTKVVDAPAPAPAPAAAPAPAPAAAPAAPAPTPDPAPAPAPAAAPAAAPA